MSSKIRVLIVDDEPLARRGIRQLLETEADFIIAGEASNGNEAKALLEKLLPDLVFLDINMPLVDGFSFVERLDAEQLPEIVFVTAYDEHAIRAFDAGAMDYVLKPINPERFQKTLERVRHRLSAGENRPFEDKITDLLNVLKPAHPYLERVTLKDNGRIQFLKVGEIDWISSLGNYVEIHSGGRKFLLRETMDGLENKLDPKEFVRIRRSTIVRIEQIKELHQLFGGEFEVVLKTNAKLLSSRRYRKNLDTLIKF